MEKNSEATSPPAPMAASDRADPAFGGARTKAACATAIASSGVRPIGREVVFPIEVITAPFDPERHATRLAGTVSLAVEAATGVRAKTLAGDMRGLATERSLDEGIVDRHAPFGFFDSADLEAWAARGSASRTLDGDLRAFLRAQFLRATIGPSFGPDVERGLVGEEATAALALAEQPSRDWEQHRSKRAALLSHASAGTLTGPTSAMVRTALIREERLLARGAPTGAPARGRQNQVAASPVEEPDRRPRPAS